MAVKEKLEGVDVDVLGCKWTDESSWASTKDQGIMESAHGALGWMYGDDVNLARTRCRSIHTVDRSRCEKTIEV